MDYLADTHTFLWYAEGSALLSPAARVAIEDPSNTIYLSFASVWEMAIKTAKKGLAGLSVSYPGGFDLWIDTALRQTGFVLYTTELRQSSVSQSSRRPSLMGTRSTTLSSRSHWWIASLSSGMT